VGSGSAAEWGREHSELDWRDSGASAFSGSDQLRDDRARQEGAAAAPRATLIRIEQEATVGRSGAADGPNTKGGGGHHQADDGEVEQRSGEGARIGRTARRPSLVRQ
jgi:hypothetical protein